MAYMTVNGSIHQPQTDTAPVLLLHCSASSGRQWDGPAQSLKPGYCAVTPDLHGYGASAPWCGPGPLTLSAEAALAAGSLPADSCSFHIVGHSYGGAVALRLAVEQPQRVLSLTLIEPVAFHVLRRGVSRDRRMLGSVERVAAGVIEGVLSGDYQAAMGRFVDYWNGDGAWAAADPGTRQRLSRHAPKVVLDFHAAISEVTTLEAYQRTFSFPVRILRGDRSPEPVRRVAERLAEAIPGAPLTTVAGAGHMLPLSHPDETLTAIRDQLELAGRVGLRAA